MKSLEQIFEKAHHPSPTGDTDSAGAAPAAGTDDPTGLTGETTGPPPVEDADSEATGSQMVPVAALLSERRKRRDAEQRLRDGEPGDTLQNSIPAPLPTEPPDDPGFLHPEHAQRLDTSEQLARGRFADYDAKLEAFTALAASDPSVAVALSQSADPATFAYQVGTQYLDELSPQPVNPVGIGSELEQQIRADERARMQAQQLIQGLPESLSGSTSAGTEAAAPWSPKPLEEIFNTL